MSLLDEDKEDLKRPFGENPGTGRKVNESGLGRFKSLNKYANLTNKYRKESDSNRATTAPAPTLASPSPIDASKHSNQEASVINNDTVEHFRGTSTSEVGAKSVQTDSSNTLDMKVGADPHPLNTDIFGSEILSQCSHEPTEVSEKSVTAKVSADMHQVINEIASQPEQSPCAAEPRIIKSDDIKVGAMSVHNDREFLNEKPHQDSLKVSAALHPQPNYSLNELNLKSKSVQNDKKVSANVGALSVRSQFEVGSIVSAKIRPLDLKELVPQVSVLTISGAQRVILDFLFEQCVFNNSLITPPLTKESLLAKTQIKEETALSSIKRLRSKHLIDRVDYKDGKGGWTRYKLAEITYKELLNIKNTRTPFVISSEQSNVRAKVGSIVSADPSSKIDRNLNNITNYTNAPTLHISWFKALNFVPVSPINPMQVNTSIRKLVEEKLSQDDVQNFINRFMTWLSGQGRVNSALALFCDKLKEYANEGDSAVLYVQTSDEIQIELELAKRAEKMRQDLELIAQTKRHEISVLNDLKFEDWYEKASDEELLKLQRPNSLMEFRGEIYKKTIKGIFLGTEEI